MYKGTIKKSTFIILLISSLLLLPTSIDAKEKARSVRLTSKNYKDEISAGVTLVDFWASWCGPCRKIAPILEELANDKELNIKVGKLNVDTYQAFAVEKGIEILPTLILYKDGQEITRFLGAFTKDELKYNIKKALE